MVATTRNKAVGIGITDVVALLFIYLVPALSHLTALPFYLLDPMRIAVLGALLLTRNWKNSLVLAVTLPLFSAAVGMHPVFPKCVLIAAELSANVLLFVWLSRAFARNAEAGSAADRAAIAAAAFMSILLSKVLYYGLKAIVLSAGLMQMDLISTALWMQLIVAAILSAGFAIRWRR